MIDIPCLSAPRLDDDEVRALVAFCRSCGAQTGLVTRGAQGALGWSGDSVLHQSPVVVALVDTLGAGDAFISAFLAASLNGKGLDEMLSAGARFAGLVCGYKGAFGRGADWQCGCLSPYNSGNG